MSKRQLLKVCERSTGDVVRTIDVSGKSERQVERITLGLLRNMSEDYYVDDTQASPPTA